MAVITKDQIQIDGHAEHIEWLLLGPSDTGEPVKVARKSDKTVHVTGTFNSNTVTMQGSNDRVSPTNWFPLTDYQGDTVGFTSVGGNVIAENPVWIRPSNSADAGSENAVKLTVS